MKTNLKRTTTTITNLTQVSMVTEEETSPSILSSNGSYFIKGEVAIDVSANAHIKRALVKLKKAGGTGRINVYRVMGNGFIEMPDVAFEHLEEVEEEGITYYVMDSAWMYQQDGQKKFSFALIAENGSSYMNIYSTGGYVEIEYVEYDPTIESRPVIKESIGEESEYKIDIFSGNMYYTIPLVVLDGGQMPLTLFLEYNSNSNINSFLRNFRFNYEQKIVETTQGYDYYDASGEVHHLKSVLGNDQIYIEQKNNFFYLKEITNGFDLVLGPYSKLKFNHLGKMIKIEVRVSDTKVITNEIEYNSAGNISKIIDDLGRFVSIEYGENAITITRPNNNTSSKTSEIIIEFDNTLDNSITGIRGLSNKNGENSYLDITMDTKYIQVNPTKRLISDGYITKVKDGSGNSVEFEFTKQGNIKKAIRKVNNNVIGSMQLSHFSTGTKVISCKNSSMIQNTIMVYQMNDEGEYIGSYEEKDNVITNIVKREYSQYDSQIGRAIKNCKQLFFSQTNGIKIVSTYNASSKNFQYYTQGITINTNSDDVHQQYLFYAEVLITSSDKDKGEEERGIYVNFIVENQIYSMKFDSSTTGVQEGGFYLSLPRKTNVSISAYVQIVNLACCVEFRNLKIYKNDQFRESGCIDKATGKNSFTTDGITWFELNNCTISFMRNGFSQIIEDVTMTYNDYLYSLESFYRANLTIGSTSNEPHFLWYNNGEGLIENVQSVEIRYSGGSRFFLKHVKLGKYQSQLNISRLNYLVYENNAELVEYSILYAGEEKKTISRYNKYRERVYSEDSHGIITKNTYYNGIETSQEQYHKNNSSQKLSSWIDDYQEDDLLIKEYTSRNASYDYFSSIIQNKVDGNIIRKILPTTSSLYYEYTNDGQAIKKMSAGTSQNELGYNHSTINYLKHNNCPYEFIYNQRNDIISVSVAGNQVLSLDYSYGAGNETKTLNYANGYTEIYEYDNYHRLIKKTRNGITTAYYIYTDEETDNLSGVNTPLKSYSSSLLKKKYNQDQTSYFYYDDQGRVIEETNGSFTKEYEYNEVSSVSQEKIIIDDEQRIYQYYYNSENFSEFTGMRSSVFNTTSTISLTKDSLQRLSAREVNNGYSSRINYQYHATSNNLSTLVSKMSYINTTFIEGSNIADNIEYNLSLMVDTITSSHSGNVRFYYDGYQRLIRENNSKLGKTTTYSYDNGGNILSKTEYPYTANTLGQGVVINYSYGNNWKDQLSSYNGLNFVYDSIGNPTTYKGATLTWEGRRLKSYHKAGNLMKYSFQYNSDGIRISKRAFHANRRINEQSKVTKLPLQEPNTVISYILDGTKIIREHEVITTPGVQIGTWETIVSDIDYSYDDSGISQIKYNNQVYYLIKDILGNVKYILNNNMSVVGMYVYDAWGKHKVYRYENGNFVEDHNSVFIGHVNPFRFKGYYYDKEIELYYCNSRYYDPETGRWINADSMEYLEPESVNGLNLYAYCENNPVMMIDSTGQSPMPNWLKWLIGGVVIVGLAIATVATGGAAAGVAGFIVAGAFKGAVIGAVSGALIGGTIGGISSAVSGNGFWSGFADGAATGFMSGAITGAITGAASNALKVGQAASLWDKGNFKSGFQSMKYHYAKHGAGFGNIVKYSNQAASFGIRNAASMTLQNSFTGMQHYWTWAVKAGMNGYFTSAGKIITFWMF